MIHIALCDDDKNALTVISGAVRSMFREKGLAVEVQCFSSGDELMKQMQRQDYDLLLLDIDMPGQDGIAIGQQIRKLYRKTDIVYVSEREDRVFEALGVQPLSFVRKGSFLHDITALAELYCENYDRRRGSEHVVFQTRTSLISLRVDSIRYIEGSRNYQLVHLIDNAQPVEVKMTMEALERDLSPRGFIRIHKGYLVNACYIYRIDSASLVLTDGQELPVSRSKAAVVKMQYLSCLE